MSDNAISVQTFWSRQVSQIKEEGWVVVKRKFPLFVDVITDQRRVFNIILFLPFVLLVRLIKPFVLLRFGILISDRIGHFCANTELYCLEKRNLNSTKRHRDFFILRYPVSNKQLLKMWRRKLNFHDFLRNIDRVNRMIPGGDDHTIRLPSDRDTKNLFHGTKPQLYFSPQELERGNEFLKSVGVEDGKFVCFHTRDSLYIKTQARIQCRNRPEKLKSRKHDYRNSDIKNCLPGMKQLVDLGYYSFRMGALVDRELKSEDSRIIDYATNGMRYDFLDIFLSAHCKFFVGNPSGLDSVATIFRAPVLSINQLPIEYAQTYLNNHVFIPQKLWLPNERRFMKFTEIFESGTGRFLRTEQYEELGVEVIENTSEEIEGAVLEMEARINGNWQCDREDEALQKKFWEIFPKSELHGKFRARIGSIFIRDNRDLL